MNPAGGPAHPTLRRRPGAQPGAVPHWHWVVTQSD
jgi:hypothetical protein